MAEEGGAEKGLRGGRNELYCIVSGRRAFGKGAGSAGLCFGGIKANCSEKISMVEC